MDPYEFSREENEVFRSLAKWLTVGAALIALAGAAMMLKFFTSDFSYWWLGLIAGVIYVVMAVTIYLPVDNFRRIATTEGNDIKELMQSFSEISKFWLVTNFITLVILIIRIFMVVEAFK